jgi:anoctamin-10
MQEVLARTLFIALAASHGFILLRAVVRHVLERAMWYGSEEKRRLDAAKLEIKERYIQSIERHHRDGGTPLDLNPDLGATAASSGEVATMTTTMMTTVPVQVAEKEGQSAETPSGDEFWQFDEGLDEIRKGIKDS